LGSIKPTIHIITYKVDYSQREHITLIDEYVKKGDNWKLLEL